MFIVFEGIDGSGKTTISNRVAKKLRKRGISVEHVREGGEFASPLMRNIRLFGKDTRNLEMVPLAEILMYCTREAQLQHDAIRPALERAQVVFADRYLHSYEVLGCHGRGLPEQQVRAILEAVSGGLWPELTVLADVDPHVARARRKSSKIMARAEEKQSGGGSRKGLAGVGTAHRLREGYRALAARDPERWLVVDNSESRLKDVVNRVTDAIVSLVNGQSVPEVVAAATAPEIPRIRALTPTVEAAGDAFYDIVEARAENEPAVAAYLLSGLEDECAWRWRDRLTEQAAPVIAYGLRGVGGELSWEARRKLMPLAPYHIARSLDGRDVEGPEAEAMRYELIEQHPEAIVATLDGNDSEHAWEIRRALGERFPQAVLASVKRIDTPQAWEVREQFVRDAQGNDGRLDPLSVGVIANSLRGIGGPGAWDLRRLCFEGAPVPTLGSLIDLFDDESWEWRRRWAERAAKVVMRTFDGNEDPRAWALRQEMGSRAKEAIDSIVGLDSDQAWALREQCAAVWPSTVGKSLVPLAGKPRADEFMERLLGEAPANISLLKHGLRMAGACDVESD